MKPFAIALTEEGRSWGNLANVQYKALELSQWIPPVQWIYANKKW
jgi:hypothetical protein